MSDSILTPRRVRIALRCIGFVMMFTAVVRLLLNLASALFGSREFFGDFLPLDAVLGAIQLAAGWFLIARAADLARFMAEEREDGGNG